MIRKADLPEMAQTGSVYTPPGLRNPGHARRAVAPHPQEARAAAAQSAVLFALGKAAVRAYQAMGFTRIGDHLHIDFARSTRPGGHR